MDESDTHFAKHRIEFIFTMYDIGKYIMYIIAFEPVRVFATYTDIYVLSFEIVLNMFCLMHKYGIFTHNNEVGGGKRNELRKCVRPSVRVAAPTGV